MRFLVLVTPVPDEAQVVTRAEALAGLHWLQQKIADGTLAAAEAYPQTGGYMIMTAASRAALAAALADYPLRRTIETDVRELVSLDEGFGVLLNAVDAYEKART